MMNHEKPLIAVDLDDVLFDFVGTFFEWHNLRYQTELTPEDMVVDSLWQVWGGTKEQANKRVPMFFGDVNLLAIEPVHGARETLDRLRDEFRFAIVSARDPSALAISEAWIEKFLPGIFDPIYLGIANPMTASKSITKAKVCKQLGATFLIDDQLVNAEACVDEGIGALLFGDYPWNQRESLSKGIVRAKDWNVVLSQLVR
jgi:5'(3')-deoxyribonucleotidase